LARLPIWITDITREQGRALVRWEGPNGLFQLQRCDLLDEGGWTNVGTVTSAKEALDLQQGGRCFYRVEAIFR